MSALFQLGNTPSPDIHFHTIVKSNVEWVHEGESVRVLDESLTAYGIEKGQVLTVQSVEAVKGDIPVWTSGRSLHARFIRNLGAGWRTAFTAYGYAGEIQFSVDPAQRLIIVGWLRRVETLADRTN